MEFLLPGLLQSTGHLAPIAGITGLVIFLKIVVFVLNRPAVKGSLGEYAVARSLRSRLPATYHRLNDLLIPDGQGASTQIDHLVVSRFGIFVIETKNFKGWIFGGPKDRNWTVSYRGRRKHRMLNPILQNQGHIRALESLLNLPASRGCFHNLVYLAGDAQLKTGPIPGVFHRGLCDHILSHQSPVLSEKQVSDIVRRLEGASLSSDRAARAAHLAHVRSRQPG